MSIKRVTSLRSTFTMSTLLLCWIVSRYTSATSNVPGKIEAPFKKKQHTRLTGYGSHSVRKSIFADEKFPSNKNPTLFVQRTEDGNLWFQSTPTSKNRNVTNICVSVKNGTLNASICSDNEIPGGGKWVPIEGVYGIYEIPSGTVVVLISSSQKIYTAPRKRHKWWQVRRVTSLELVHLACSSSKEQLSQRQIKEETRQLRLLRYALRQHDFYFALSSREILDMTHTMQRSFEGRNTKKNKASWWEEDSSKRPDSRFFWNEPSVQPLLELHHDTRNKAYSTLLEHVIPVTSAFVGIQTNLTLANSLRYDEILISRRSRFRAGTRFTKRGSDGTGAVTNYAESEQLCILYNESKTELQQVLSHVQTRGSIPLRWSSPADVKTYAPRIRIGTDPLAQARALRGHLFEQWSLYASSESPLPKNHQLVFVNLIDMKHDQGRLGRAFDSVLEAVLDVYTHFDSNKQDSSAPVMLPPNMVKHVWYDFHAECKGGRWDKLQNLLNDVSSTLEEQGYFCATPPCNKETTWNIIRRQRGVLRTNCMDCLDRTNVVQSIFGRYMLFRQLYEQPGSLQTKASQRSLPLTYAAAFRRNGMTLPWATGEVAHRLLWADNADAISRLYAGTPALKGDFTRTGKRTKRGALDDGMNSLQRYYINNFLDADRQEGIDLMIGYTDFAVVDDNHESPDDEQPYMHIKSPQSQKRLRDVSPYAARRPLDLRWLPGDLQSHMRSQAAALGDGASLLSHINEAFCPAYALDAIDRRAASDEPWWVTSDSSDDENDLSPHSLVTGSNNAGHVVGGLVASVQAPIATAVAVVCMLLPGSKPGAETKD